jgi:hypothetical protein
MKSEIIQLRLSKEEKEKIRQFARVRHTSISQLLRSFINALESLEALSINK